MITTDDIMALLDAASTAHHAYLMGDSLESAAASDRADNAVRAAVAALVAERDLAIHEQDVAQESLRQHQVWLQEAQAERDALRQDAERWKYVRDHSEWIRHSPNDCTEPPYAHMAVRLPYRTDLSCKATRKDAIDAAIAGEQK